MKRKTINKVIKNKIIGWIATLPPDMREDVQKSVIVTGGSIASMLLQEKVNDYDIYFSSKEPLVRLVEHYLRGRKDVYIDDIIDEDDRVRIIVESDGARKYEPAEEEKYSVIYLTENAVTLSDKIQIVTRFIGSPEEIHENYDFIHATNYWTFKEGLVLNTRALTSLLTKELFYAGSKYPLCSIIRTRKFVKRGFTINAGQYLKMALQLNELDLLDKEVLRDQLVGVDSAYFDAFIRCIENKIDKKGVEAITTTYLCRLVDYVFDRDVAEVEEGEEA